MCSNKLHESLFLILLIGALTGSSLRLFAGDQKPYVQYSGAEGSGNGKHIVLIAGDEEYRSEEALPQLGKILAKRHGFKCTVLFPIDPKTGHIKPNFNKNIPGTGHLKTADLMVIFTRYRSLPHEQMVPIDNYLKQGGPVIGIRPTVVGFRFGKDSPWHHYSDGYNGSKKAWHLGFGKLVLGQDWDSHHGKHGRESTRGIVADDAEDHPITNGVEKKAIWGPTDVYEAHPPDNATILVKGQVLSGMEPDSKPNASKNNPMMPIAWLNPYQLPEGKKGTAFTTTIGDANDFENAALRRLFVNSVYHLLNLTVPERANVNTVGKYTPNPFGFGNFKKGMTPSKFRTR